MMRSPPSTAERRATAKRLGRVRVYSKPERVWVEDGHVFVEGHDGGIVSMTPEIAIDLGRLLSNAGSDSLVNKILDETGTTGSGSPTDG